MCNCYACACSLPLPLQSGAELASEAGDQPQPQPQPGGPHDYFPDLPAWYQPSGPSDTTLVFESRFESGNLRRALQVGVVDIEGPDGGGGAQRNARGWLQLAAMEHPHSAAQRRRPLSIQRGCACQALQGACTASGLLAEAAVSIPPKCILQKEVSPALAFPPPPLVSLLQVYPYEYDLVLRPDVNTRGHTQWFYFSVANTRAGARYKFNIINLLKEDSLYNDGMQVSSHAVLTCGAGRPAGMAYMHAHSVPRKDGQLNACRSCPALKAASQDGII